MRLGAVVACMVGVGLASRGAAADGLAEARALGIVAEGRLTEGRAAEAAGLYERAGQLTLEAGWWLAAGDAWIEAVEPGKALRAYRQAETSAGEARRAVVAERIERATHCEREVASARAAVVEGKFLVAAQRWGRAFEKTGGRRYGVEAARAFAQAGRLDEALRRYRELLLRADLTVEERAGIEGSLAEIRKQPTFDGEGAVAPRAPGATADTGEGAAVGLVIGGAVLTVFGVASLAVSEDARVDLRHAESSAVDGRIEEITRADAVALSRTAKTWNAVGWVVGGVGVAAVLGGSLWLVAQPSPSAATVTVGGRF